MNSLSTFTSNLLILGSLFSASAFAKEVVLDCKNPGDAIEYVACQDSNSTTCEEAANKVVIAINTSRSGKTVTITDNQVIQEDASYHVNFIYEGESQINGPLHANEVYVSIVGNSCEVNQVLEP